MTQCRFISVDLETTGFSPSRGDRVVEVGAVAVEHGNIVREFHSLIDPGKPIPISAQQVHGITDQMLLGQPKPDEVFPRFRAFVGDGILVAHNASFDVHFLHYEFARLGMGFTNPYRCTLEMSRRLFPRLRNHRLETVCRHLFGHSIETIQEHRALGDARMVARVWMEMGKR